MDKVKQDELIKRLKAAVEVHDNETVHIIFDELVLLRLKQHEPSYIKYLNKLVKDIGFFYI